MLQFDCRLKLVINTSAGRVFARQAFLQTVPLSSLSFARGKDLSSYIWGFYFAYDPPLEPTPDRWLTFRLRHFSPQDFQCSLTYCCPLRKNSATQFAWRRKNSALNPAPFVLSTDSILPNDLTVFTSCVLSQHNTVGNVINKQTQYREMAIRFNL